MYVRFIVTRGFFKKSLALTVTVVSWLHFKFNMPQFLYEMQVRCAVWQAPFLCLHRFRNWKGLSSIKFDFFLFNHLESNGLLSNKFSRGMKYIISINAIMSHTEWFHFQKSNEPSDKSPEMKSSMTENEILSQVKFQESIFVSEQVWKWKEQVRKRQVIYSFDMCNSFSQTCPNNQINGKSE